jgi:hypothetical protein
MGSGRPAHHPGGSILSILGACAKVEEVAMLNQPNKQIEVQTRMSHSLKNDFKAWK